MKIMRTRKSSRNTEYEESVINAIKDEIKSGYCSTWGLLTFEQYIDERIGDFGGLDDDHYDESHSYIMKSLRPYKPMFLRRCR
jgi:hypothetical protein